MTIFLSIVGFLFLCGYLSIGWLHVWVFGHDKMPLSLKTKLFFGWGLYWLSIIVSIFSLLLFEMYRGWATKREWDRSDAKRLRK